MAVCKQGWHGRLIRALWVFLSNLRSADDAAAAPFSQLALGTSHS
eukprot:CAMPEP_0204219524 /NCGR_PEP_ID=MMETSP0361-20130328/80358_1 /ASSEMBLY_ACC=CAM_ASM_000343 /TAXON_ID=268821 /ORGANISM="Scrippsiella Hangoei, Strain SHTV-5" /LENGTH=44 /DNA_ID= /DNA_START= /DNA_END= /DNA_ORIENTATION=